MTKKHIKQLETAGRKLEKCGGDCRRCDKCHIIHVGRNAPDIWRSVATCSRLSYILYCKCAVAEGTQPPWSLSNLNCLKTP